jgi:hypothetical protein
MSDKEIRELMENALAQYAFEEVTDELLEEMHQSAINALSDDLTVGYLRPLFKDMPNFWTDDHIVYVEVAEPFESPHAEFSYGDDVNLRFCARLEG